MYMKYTYTCQSNLWYTFEMIALENRSKNYLKSSQLWSLRFGLFFDLWFFYAPEEMLKLKKNV